MRVRTGTRVGRGLAIGIVAAAVMVLVPAVPAGAKTTVKVKGDVVTITVPIDCVGCKDYVDPINGRKLAKYWEKTAEDAWNAVFNKWPYCSKYKLKLDIKMKNRPAGSASRFGPHELIATEPDGRGFTGAGWGGAPESTPGGPEGQRVSDGTRYYEFDAQGTMPADATPTVIAHEFGHVMGLGDDRDDAGNGVPGRDGTIMVGGATGVTPNTKLRIDKSLIDRIGDQLANLGKIDCGVAWNGPIEGHLTAPGCSPSEVPVHGELNVRVAERGQVRGSGGWVEDAFSCGGVTAGPFPMSFALTGTKTDERFNFDPVTVGQPLALDINGSKASATVDVLGNAGYGSSLTFTLNRQDKKEAVG